MPLTIQGPDIEELTLVSWVSLDDLDHRNGSALTLDRTDIGSVLRDCVR